MDFNKILDLPVVGEKGNKLGIVEDVLISKSNNKVEFLLIATNKLLGLKKLLPISEVLKVTRYNVKVKGEGLLNISNKLEELPFYNYKSGLYKKKVSEFGGHIDDGLFDMETGTIIEFVISDGILEDLISGRKRIVQIEKILGDNN